MMSLTPSLRTVNFESPEASAVRDRRGSKHFFFAVSPEEDLPHPTHQFGLWCWCVRTFIEPPNRGAPKGKTKICLYFVWYGFWINNNVGIHYIQDTDLRFLKYHQETN